MAQARCIYRTERPGGVTGGWYVQIRFEGRVRSKSFSDNKHGGKDAAFAAAIAYRDELFESLGIGERLRKPENLFPGVSRTESTRTDSGRQRTDAHWQAYWIDDTGKQQTQRFSVKKLGEEGAKAAAVFARRHAERSLETGEDPFFIAPASSRSRLWRYMDFTKFLALLEDSYLFFSKSSQFEDPYEGAFSKSNRVHREFVLSRSQQNLSVGDDTDVPQFAISCWYSAFHESAAMWNLYARSTDAIAICTTYGKLRSALPECVKIGLVKYADYNQQWISEQAPIHRFMYKRMSFQHEKELRAVADLSDPDTARNGKIENGNYLVRLDLNRLITHIFVSPKSQDWFDALVRKVCKRYGVKVEPIRSSLYDGPVT